MTPANRQPKHQRLISREKKKITEPKQSSMSSKIKDSKDSTTGCDRSAVLVRFAHAAFIKSISTRAHEQRTQRFIVFDLPRNTCTHYPFTSFVSKSLLHFASSARRHSLLLRSSSFNGRSLTATRIDDSTGPNASSLSRLHLPPGVERASDTSQSPARSHVAMMRVSALPSDGMLLQTVKALSDQETRWRV